MHLFYFYFIAASQQFILLQPSVQVQHFHARLVGGRDLSCLSNCVLLVLDRQPRDVWLDELGTNIRPW